MTAFTVPVVCTPWCEGLHDSPISRACWSAGTYIGLSLSQDPEPEQIGVYAYRRHDHAAPAVRVHIELDGVDVDPCLTPSEARRLAEMLTAAADATDGRRGARPVS